MAYIKGIGAISPQLSFGNRPFDAKQNLACMEPDYADWIDARSIRRMSKVIRIGVASAVLALKEAGIGKPDVIIAGTGLGCVTDTTQFLTKIVENKEEALNPTPFIQSTHNTIASQIALLLQCLGYNQTYSQRGLSFECAMQDALMSLNENPMQQILVGGVDEGTEVSSEFFKKIGFSDVDHGEGAAFFALDNSRAGAWAEIVGMRTIYKPKTSADVKSQIENLLEAANIKMEEIDLILLGDTGSKKYDLLMNEVASSFFQPILSFKRMCGEYSTSSSFALWLASMAIKKGFAPGLPDVTKVESVLIYNQYFNQHHSVILLKRVD